VTKTNTLKTQKKSSRKNPENKKYTGPSLRRQMLRLGQRRFARRSHIFYDAPASVGVETELSHVEALISAEKARHKKAMAELKNRRKALKAARKSN